MNTAWTVRATLRWAHEYLRRAGASEARRSAEELLAHALAVERLGLYLHPERAVSAKSRRALRALLARRARGEPTQRVVGEVSFMGHRLRVDGSALVPRFETEQLVERAVQRLPEGTGARFLDAGTGTGAIAIALAKARPLAHGLALDCSPAALALARENAARNGVAERLAFAQGNWLSGVHEEFDLVVSNPPYVPSGQIKALSPEVRHDPRVALDGGVDGLAAVRRLIYQAPARLKPGGWLAFELGADQAPAVRRMLQAAGFVEGRGYLDLSGVERIVEGRWEGGCHASSKSLS